MKSWFLSSFFGFSSQSLQPTFLSWSTPRIVPRGRDTEVDGTAIEPFEDYWFIAWPADPTPERVHKQTDHYGATVRASAERNRPPR